MFPWYFLKKDSLQVYTDISANNSTIRKLQIKKKKRKTDKNKHALKLTSK